MGAIELVATPIDHVPKLGRHSKQWRVCWDTYYRGRHGISSITFPIKEDAEAAARTWSKWHKTYIQEVGCETRV